ncbi:MAG: hypothetical protein K8S99_06920 [Planctomycetes bacterium]|nr:hypothetical protein [Planctomycetota bacterium]
METTPHIPTQAVPLNRAARYLRVPAGWLRDEVNAHRLPGLHAGRVILVHVPTVADLLSERARHGEAVQR